MTPYSALADVLITPHGIQRLVSRQEPSAPVVATYSQKFLRRLEEQAKWAKDTHRTPLQMTLSDGTVVLTGE